MRLIHNAIEYSFEFTEDVIHTLVVESPQCMRTLITDLKGQIEGGDGGFVLSTIKTYNELSLTKECELIMDPFFDQTHNRLFASKLIQNLRVMAHNEEYFEQTAAIESNLLEFAAILMQGVEESLTYNDSIDSLSLLKLLGFALDFEDSNPIENLITYIKACNRYTAKSLFIFVNAKSFYQAEEMAFLADTIHGMKCHLMLIENHSRQAFATNEKCCIIDVDYCEIF